MFTGYSGAVHGVFSMLPRTSSTTSIRSYAPAPPGDSSLHRQSHTGVPSPLPYLVACPQVLH